MLLALSGRIILPLPGIVGPSQATLGVPSRSKGGLRKPRVHDTMDLLVVRTVYLTCSTFAILKVN